MVAITVSFEGRDSKQAYARSQFIARWECGKIAWMQLGENEAGNGTTDQMSKAEIAKKRVAVVAMQGDFEKHIQMLRSIGADAFKARTPAEVDGADAVILPGGESTTIGKLLARFGVDKAIRRAAAAGKPVYGTCAGLILLARDIQAGTGEQGGQPTLGLLDVTVSRNAFGRQVDSFEADLDVPAIGADPLHAVFIRAPIVVEAGPKVETLASIDGKTVFVKQGSVLGSSFHPELTGDDRVHRYFLSLIQ